MTEKNELHQQFQRIEDLVGRIEALADPAVRADACELVQSLMDLHGAGIERMMQMIADTGEPGMGVIDQFTSDKLVASLLLLYGLHPLAFETRVVQALDKVRPYLQSHGGDVELLGISGGDVQLRLLATGNGCGSSAPTLKAAIEEAMYEAAPDMTALHVDSAVQPQPPSGLVQLQGRAASHGSPGWAEANVPDSLVLER